MNGKWADGIRPRNFAWVIKDCLAACERPGGYGQNHRRVRRQEEIIWIRQQVFDVTVSMIPSQHNLHNYDELGLSYLHRPWPVNEFLPHWVEGLYSEIKQRLEAGQKILIHKEDVGDRVCGLIAGYLLHAGLVTSGPQATAITERIFERQLGSVGRGIVELSTSDSSSEIS